MNLHIIPFSPQCLEWRIWGDTSGICSEEAWKQAFPGSCYGLCRWTGILFWLSNLYVYFHILTLYWSAVTQADLPLLGYVLCWLWANHYSFGKMSSSLGRLHHTKKLKRWSLQTPYQSLQQERSFEGNSERTWLLDSERTGHNLK